MMDYLIVLLLIYICVCVSRIYSISLEAKTLSEIIANRIAMIESIVIKTKKDAQ